MELNKTKLTRMKKAELIDIIISMRVQMIEQKGVIAQLQATQMAQDNAIPFEQPQPTPKPQPTLKPNQKIVQKWGISFIETNHGKYVSHVRA